MSTFFTLAAVLVGFVSPEISASLLPEKTVSNESDVFESVEVGVAELSPNGVGGGYAVPASGSSNSTCTLVLSPSSLVEGSGDVVLNWGSTAPNTANIKRYVGTDTSGAVTNLGTFTNGDTDTEVSGLSAGYYTYLLEQTTTAVHTVCTTDDSVGNTVCYDHNAYTNYSCVETLEVTGPPQCSDGSDNDGDGTTDYPNDPGCDDANDDDETDPAPTVSLTASPSSVAYGSSTDLTWTVSGSADTCTASGDWSGGKSVSGGTQTQTGLLVDQNYSITCTGPGGSGSDSASVTVASPGAPTVTLVANPSAVAYDASSTLTWTVSGSATLCTATDGSGSWPGSKSIAGGSEDTEKLTVDTSYSIQCTGPGDDGNIATADITVGAAPQPNLTSQNLSVPSLTVGQSATLQAEVYNNGTAGTGVGFDDIFEYSYTGSAPWTPIGTVVKSALANGDTSSDSKSFTPPSAGTIYIQHCIDHGDAVSESDESVADNCSSQTFTVSAAPSPTATISACDLGGANCHSDSDSGNKSITTGQEIEIQWGSSNAASCAFGNFDGNDGDSDPTTGGDDTTVTEPAATLSTTYSVNCDGAYKEVTVTNSSADSVSIGVGPGGSKIVRSGTPVELEWDIGTNDENTCDLTGPGVNTTILVNNTNDVPNDAGDGTGGYIVTVTNVSTYEIECGDQTAKVVIQVTPNIDDN